jgi:CheY-like chemotaxis protein
MAREILIATSDKADREDLKKIFDVTDYKLVFSESGEDVLLRVKLFKPDLIIAATALQKKDGREICETVKNDLEYRDIPFILLTNFFEEIPERDLKRLRADGIISKPLREGEVLNLVDQLMDEEAVKQREEESTGRGKEHMKDTPKKEEEILLHEPKTEEEEIIELFDVVEEPEQNMSIDDFVAPATGKQLGEILPVESWEEKLTQQERPAEKDLALSFEDKEIDMEELSLSLEKEAPPKEETRGEDLFEKIELEEILEQVEQMKPSIEKEWPEEEKKAISSVATSQPEEAAENLFSLEEFETALRQEVKDMPSPEELQPFYVEEVKKERSEEAAPTEGHEEEPQEEILEEALGEDEIGIIEEEIAAEELSAEEIGLGEIEPVELMPKEKVAQEAVTQKVEKPEIPLQVLQEEIKPAPQLKEKGMEEIVSKGVREMTEALVTKLVPEMTRSIVGLTLDRIETVVKEIVPELAEKAIQEEIRKLEEGEKE